MTRTEIENMVKKALGHIQVETDFSLRYGLGRKVLKAKDNGARWTLFIGKDGLTCHAVTPTGIMIRMPKAPKHLKNVKHKEHVINHFYNIAREMFGDGL